MRTLNQLYVILWEEIKDHEHIYGLCFEVEDLFHKNKITYDEWKLLNGHFKSQKPSDTQHTDFIYHPNWLGRSYWWNEDEDYNPTERKRFIKLMIKITK